jgi:hypothetical protein
MTTESLRLVVVSLGAAAATLASLLLRSGPTWRALAIAFAAAAPLYAATAGYYPAVPAELVYPPVPLLTHLREQPGPFRIVATRGVLPPNSSTAYRLADVRSFDPAESSRYVDWVVDVLGFDTTHHLRNYRPRPQTVPALRLLGVRFLLAPQRLAVPAPWRDHGVWRATRLWELPGPSPWAFFPQVVHGVPDAATARASLLHRSDLHHEAPVESPQLSAAVRKRNDGARVSRVQVAGDRVHVAVDGDTTGRWLVVSQTAIPGWRAHADGRPLRVDTAYGLLLAVRLPAAARDVQLSYHPLGWRLGAALSALGLLGTLPFVLSRRLFHTAPGSS